MKPLGFALLALFAAGPSHAALTLTHVGELALTPNETDSIGVFSRWFHHPGRDRFYEVYAGRPAFSPRPPGVMTHLAWREYDSAFQHTGRRGSLVGPPSAGDFAMAQVDSTYFVLSVDGWDYRLSRFDDDFVPEASTTITLDVHDSNTDQLMGVGNGRLLIGSLHEPTATHPRFPMQPAWTPAAHLFQYDTSLQPVAPDRYLEPTFYAWGGSATWNPANQRYVVVSMDSFPTYKLDAYEYDADWTLLGIHRLAEDGQWSQGLVWDGSHYFVAWHSGHEHRCGNIEVAAFDIHWNREASVRITDYATFPPPPGPGRSAQRPFITKVGDTLFVSYDVESYNYLGGTAVLGNKAWQARVGLVRIGSTSAAPATSPGALRMHPTPTHGRIRWTWAGAPPGTGTAELLDVAGRVLERRTAAPASGAFELGSRSPGVYFVRLRGVWGEQVRRVVRVE